MNDRSLLLTANRIVVKIGSALLTNNGKGLDREAMAGWVAQMASLVKSGKQVVLVSSGSIAEGVVRLGWSIRPTAIHQLQAAAAVGQMGLVQAYEDLFKKFELHTAQILLDHDDLANRQRYLNARNTLQTLIELGVVPVVNENDTVVTDEIRFGDNDTLGALVANLIDADLLIILTDKNGLYDSNPDHNPNAQLVECGLADDRSLDALAGDTNGTLGRGGMVTKLRAGRLAARSGCNTLILGGRNESILTRAMAGENVGTLLLAKSEPIAARKQWLAGRLKVKGSLVLDPGAVEVLQKKGRSLLAVGVSASSGDFKRGDLVACFDDSGTEIARGLVNYNSDETKLILRKSSDQIEQILGYRDDNSLIHRDNLVLV